MKGFDISPAIEDPAQPKCDDQNARGQQRPGGESIDDDLLDSLFHFAALQAFLEQAAIQGGPPCVDATRERAFRLYENALAEKHGKPPRYAGLGD